ncbi:MAG: epoxyqueuosine reductase QueH, partial [Vagococcus sp.]
MVKEKELTEEREGGKRCSACFNMRLDLVAEKAQELGFDYFGSALTISPKKNSQLINQIGMDIQKFYDVNYLPSDFKKNKGYERSIEMCKEYNIYRQCYCGCIFAAKQQGVDLKQVTKEARQFLKEES